MRRVHRRGVKAAPPAPGPRGAIRRPRREGGGGVSRTARVGGTFAVVARPAIAGPPQRRPARQWPPRRWPPPRRPPRLTGGQPIWRPSPPRQLQSPRPPLSLARSRAAAPPAATTAANTEPFYTPPPLPPTAAAVCRCSRCGCRPADGVFSSCARVTGGTHPPSLWRLPAAPVRRLGYTGYVYVTVRPQ